MSRKTKYYRPEIDGLRAIAIIPVFLFHLGITGFSGGYIGVDVFFVISGFLITSIIIREINENNFSLVNFWSRRIRRIIPVLSFVLITTTFASYFIILYPPDFVDFGYSLVAQSLFMINLFFMRTDDYFAAPSETIPLLHTWSLAVEEQFYILFPIVVLLICKWKKKALLYIFIILGILSLLYSIYLVNISPDIRFSIPFLPNIWGGATNTNAGFYFPVARAWELLAGAIVALLSFNIKKKVFAEIISFVGLFLIIASVFYLNEESQFPGIAAIAPVLGTCLIIITNKKHNTLTKQILSFPIFIGIGLISYSLYLWHWPVIVLTNFYTQAQLDTKSLLAIILLTFSLSYLSYRFVETPFLKKQILPGKYSVITAGFLLLLTTGALGILIIKNDGFTNRAPAVSQEIAEAAIDENPRLFECFKNSYRKLTSNREPCYLGNADKEGPVDFVLWGDSHANAVMPGFDMAAKELGQKGIFYAIGGCSPIIYKNKISKDVNCIELKQDAIKFIDENEVERVFLVSAWKESYLDNSGNKITALDVLDQTLQNINPETEIVIMKRTPIQGAFETRDQFYRHLNKTSLSYNIKTINEHTTDTKESQKAIDYLSQRENVSVIDPTEILCVNRLCPVEFNNKIVYKDSDHMNTSGALLLVDLIKRYMTR